MGSAPIEPASALLEPFEAIRGGPRPVRAFELSRVDCERSAVRPAEIGSTAEDHSDKLRIEAMV